LLRVWSSIVVLADALAVAPVRPAVPLTVPDVAPVVAPAVTPAVVPLVPLADVSAGTPS